jgi:hypothetical protein
MRILVILLFASGGIPGQIDAICHGPCRGLEVRNGTVRFIDRAPEAPRTVVLGRYVPTAQRFVPRVEAPIRDLKSPGGWHVVVSAFLHHDEENEGEIGTRVRFFAPGATVSAQQVIPGRVQQASIGRLFGGADDVFAIATEDEHAYNVDTEIWLLPKGDKPRSILSLPGVYEQFVGSGDHQTAGVRVSRETYDGEHSETKGRVPEFWKWNPENKSLLKVEQ